MQLINSIVDLPPKSSDKKRILVPTMGNLHVGHLALVEQACTLADEVVVSIYVNPKQFAPNEDFASYPRTLDADLAQLSAHQVAWVFAPDTTEMYARPEAVSVMPSAMGRILEGAHRPNFFHGVLTVVAKLFNLIQPDMAVFGSKDYQQWRLIEQMCQDLNWPVELVIAPTIREHDGLALSSRNGYLTPTQRQHAALLYQQLRHIVDTAEHDKRPNWTALSQAGIAALAQAGWRCDYLSVCQAENLLAPEADSRDLVVLAAAWLGTTRLIDNIAFTHTLA